MPKLFKILAIDGGGIRGIIPARILEEIETKTGKHIAGMFDMIAGTSTGGILALGLAKPDGTGNGKPQYCASDLLKLYFTQGHTIFPQSIWRKIRTADYTLDERYPSNGIETVLQQYFGTSYLREALTNLLITSYEIEIRMPWLFRSDRAKKNKEFDFPMWQVARATSAAPTYFEPARIDKLNGEGNWALVDGGTYANNPAMCAYAEARKLDPDADILLVSLGTGELTRPIHYQAAKDWGLIGWAKPILDVVFDGVSKTTDYQLHQLIPAAAGKRRHYRFQASLTIASDDMDNTDPKNLNDLQAQADALIEAQRADLDDLCGQIC
jgi:patatin-like phospholipase/acyl hydrolase